MDRRERRREKSRQRYIVEAGDCQTFRDANAGVAKHADAKTVGVMLKREGPMLILEVRDDGAGIAEFASDPARLHGAGIRNLRERAEMTGGEFSLSSELCGGTCARIVWTLNAEDLAAHS